MSAFTDTAKGVVKAKTAGPVLKNPGKVWFAGKAAKPAAKISIAPGKAFAKRGARRGALQVSQTARTVGEVLLIQVPEAAQELGVIERPAGRRTAPRVVAGAVIGAGAMYLLEPGESGRQHREKVLAMVG
jgi:hypothetical protein